MLFSWLFSNAGRLLQTYNFTLEFQFCYCCCLFIIFFCIYLLPLVASFRAKPRSTGYYPDTQDSQGKFGPELGLNARYFLLNAQSFAWTFIVLRQINQIRTDSELSKFLSALISTSRTSVSVHTPIICPTQFQYLYYVLIHRYSLYIFLNKSWTFQNTGPDPLQYKQGCPTAAGEATLLCLQDLDQGINYISLFSEVCICREIVDCEKRALDKHWPHEIL